MTSIRKQLILFLENNASSFLTSWREKLLISENDLYKEKVNNNGLKMYELVKRTLENSLDEDDIRKLAYHVAFERVEANINIGEFVYNVNLGRSEIIKWMMNSELSTQDLQPLIEEINTVFDQFTYYAVRKYTEIKEEKLQEKTLFINQTHKERLTILGQMSSSFVHEFRNPLTTVLGFAKLLKSEYPDLKYLDIMEHELHQLKARITQFLHVSKKELINDEKISLSLYELFDELLEFLYPSIVDGDVTIETNIDTDIQVLANKEELRQVFLNLFLNSIDALQQVNYKRKINIDCSMAAGNVEIMISNNGPMIPKEIIEVIFEPFFTTKELGTGIGLYVCKKIIENQHGEISCVSNDKLTTFTIKLPLL
ncbi:histidine kinase N-terminal domain-containing protein [Bacillus taeanensis]|uniref:histidine kinase n=1 Tax=Bacillus taeanensis TaxID=273032 RepID=A0A366XZT3_9BACI|nr:histidine kinase N-terminal domain-containing protein [Bacillus taeanensis]RBW69674.1 histidine kinase [Bacillus taeanensis]